MKIELAHGETVTDWIPAEEDTPVDDEIVLVTVEHLDGFDNVKTDIEIARYVKYGGYKVIFGIDEGGDEIQPPSRARFRYKRVTAWAHMPDRYERHEEE